MRRTRSHSSPSTPSRLLALAAMGAVIAGLLAPGSALGVARIAEPAAGLDLLDARSGVIAPSPAQLAAAADLGASRVSWNRFGTPRSLSRWGGYLATGLSADPVRAARDFLARHAALFRLSPQGVSGLEVVNDAPIGAGHAVLLRQRFGDLPAASDGMITVGVVDGKVAYVSSSAVGEAGAPAEAKLSPTEAWLRAAAGVGTDLAPEAISNVRQGDEWTTFDVAGMDEPQYVRLRALPTPADGVRPVFESLVLDRSPSLVGYTVLVDAVDGRIWQRRNNVDEFGLPAPSGGPFQGSTGPNGECGPLHEFEAPSGTKEIDVAASAVAGDIILNLWYLEPDPDVKVAQSDIPAGENPEVIQYAPPAVPAGTYAAQVCDFDPADGPMTYGGSYFVNDAASAAFPFPPRWRAFPASPPLDYSSTDTRELWCWVSSIDGSPLAGCDRELINDAARAPWDQDPFTDTPTFTTHGNAADSSEAWLGPLTPAEQYRPVSPQRAYDFPWTNQWYESKCDPAVFLSPRRNDIDAATANLFAMHNRMHDWSYFLGFTEETYNLQEHNYGNTRPGPYPVGRELDPELGDAQAGAVNGGAPEYLGRDNANQRTLPDGLPGITNMYLWQAIPASFYAPCVDGDYDMSVIAHEYTHAISNRMVGGPDSGLTSSTNGQALAMGESYSDLNAVEYLHEYGLLPVDGENPFAVGPYVTGDRQVGIRNYGMNHSPLNYGDIQGYDPSGGTGPHEDGEIWSATNYDIRQLLVRKYNGRFPAADAALQRQCADGGLPADRCPGNRRWIQIMYDAFLLMPPDVDMLDSRDAYLAADVMRFDGANQAELWRGFATRGMGEHAASPGGTEDAQPVPNFESPLAPEAQVTFVAKDAETGDPINATVYAGDFEGAAVCGGTPCPGVTPVADTDPATPLGDVAGFVPNRYDFLIVAPGHGGHRFTRTLGTGPVALTALLAPNRASSAQGGTAAGDGVRTESIIDDTESTNWEAPGTPNIRGKQVTVDLGGDAHVVKYVGVSGMLQGDQTGGPNRFTPVRQFEILTCDATAADCADPASFTSVFVSPADAFPADVPRPTAPDIALRLFKVTPSTATHVRLIVLENQCTGGPAYQGDQDNDPTNDSDCQSGSAADETVRVAELQVFGGRSTLGGASERLLP